MVVHGYSYVVARTSPAANIADDVTPRLPRLHNRATMEGIVYVSGGITLEKVNGLRSSMVLS